ncbi:putative sodium-coupled neutral amino acid transporter 10 isoform X2 [Bombina bombina]|uniref:putative sodium-coupled neutral amino acid transporter 10 isoform X2 n=1 Tax=Bombina bombina TaxID=8345 RepID=UPI00235A7928|nr:putative sodium-coupled neutral amino acid transporter 10 isoform X2 [Bombina bombina]
MAASNWGLIMNIVNSIVGVSVLTMPFCFNQCGIVLGTLLLMLCAWMTHQSCMFLVKSASVSKRRTYAGLAFHAYGKAGKMLVETSMIGLMLGTCIAFYVVIGDLGSSFFARLLGLQMSENFRVFLLFAVSLCIVLPLSLQRNMMASIQSFSAMALIFYTVFMFVIVLSSFKHGLFSGQWMEHVSYVRWEGLFRCVPIFGMSFACQSQVLPTYDILDEPSVKIMSSIFASSLNVVTTFYVTVGFFGYVSFTESIAGNVLVNFPSNLVTEMIRVGFMMSVAVGFPMMILPCRQALNTLLFEQQQKDGTFTAGGYMPPLRFKVLTLTVVFGTMLGGILIPNVETILGVTGATMGSLICFICPALIYKKVHKKGLTSQFILGVGLVILIISTYTTVIVKEDAPVQGKNAPVEREKLNEGKLDLDLPKISAQKPIVEEPADDRDKPKEPPKKLEVEQPQIKGPIDVPQKEEAKGKHEEVQLDRPDQGIAVPMGEAHRHEPPVPRDEVDVDEVKDKEDSDEKKPPEVKADAAPNEKLEEPVPKPKETHLSNKEEGVQAPQGQPQMEGESNMKDNAPMKEEKEERPPYKDLEAKGKDVEIDIDPKKKLEVTRDRGNLNLLQPGNALEKQLVEGDKVQIGADIVPEVQNVDLNPGENQEGADKAELLDHAILLQVIKEQQVQQKRLLDQQEKLLEVIKEQHLEIHQQKEEEQQEKPEEQVAEQLKSKEEMKAAGQEDIQVVPVDLEKEEKTKDAAEKPDLQKLAPAVDVAKGSNSLLENNVKLQPLEIKRSEDHLEPQKADHPAGVVQVPREESEIKKQASQELINKQVDIQAAGDNQVQQKDNVQSEDKDKGIQSKAEFVKPIATSRPKEPVAPQEINKVEQFAAEQREKGLKETVIQLQKGAPHIEKRQDKEEVVAQKGNILNEDQEHQKQALNLPEQQGDRKEADALEVAVKPAIDSQVDVEEGKQVQLNKVAPEHDQGKQNKDLKLQNDLDLKRRKRDVAEENVEGDGAQIISFHPVPNLKMDNLRGALETRLNQVAEAGLQVIHSRQIKQLTDNEKKR